MCLVGVIMKGRRVFVLKVLIILQCGYRKNLFRKILKLQIFELLVYFGVLFDSFNVIILKDLISEKNKRLIQKLIVMMLEILGLFIFICKESKILKFMDKGDEMNINYLIVKVSNMVIFQIYIIVGCGILK